MDLTHLNEKGEARMVDVGGKPVTRRMAVAISEVLLPPIVAQAFDGDDLQLKKGSVFQTARIAGIMAAKRCHELIPLCHPLLLDLVKLDLTGKMESSGGLLVSIRCEVALSGRTGVEMEALTGASIAALTVYDMCKALSHEIVIRDTRLMEKDGGRRRITEGKLQR
jgi:cyclic pyranopterin phosphate synthase